MFKNRNVTIQWNVTLALPLVFFRWSHCMWFFIIPMIVVMFFTLLLIELNWCLSIFSIRCFATEHFSLTLKVSFTVHKSNFEALLNPNKTQGVDIKELMKNGNIEWITSNHLNTNSNSQRMVRNNNRQCTQFYHLYINFKNVISNRKIIRWSSTDSGFVQQVLKKGNRTNRHSRFTLLDIFNDKGIPWYVTIMPKVDHPCHFYYSISLLKQKIWHWRLDVLFFCEVWSKLYFQFIWNFKLLTFEMSLICHTYQVW